MLMGGARHVKVHDLANHVPFIIFVFISSLAHYITLFMLPTTY
jgi:hypothetical protein